MSSPVPHWTMDDTAELQRARRLWQQRSVDEALEGFRAAVVAAPDNVRGLIEAAQALAGRFELDEALGYLDRAAELAGDDVRVGPAIGQAYRACYRPASAISMLERLARQNRLPPPRWAELAVLYEQTNQPQAALGAIARCLEQAPDQPEPQLIHARLLVNEAQYGAAERIVLSLVQRASASPLLRARAFRELARIKDAQQDYAAALDAVRQAMTIQSSDPQVAGLRQRSQTVSASFGRLYEQLDQTVLHRWLHETPHAPLPCAGAAFLFSFPRSGTTLLEQQLDRHPRLTAAPERTIFARETFPSVCQQFDTTALSFDALDRCPRERLEDARQHYFACHMAIHGTLPIENVHLDKNPNLTSLLAGVIRVFPEARLLFAVRDPRDILVSACFQFWPLTEYSVAFLDWADACIRYEEEMKIWLRVRDWLPKRLEVRYEALTSDRAATCAEVWRFLGLTPEQARVDEAVLCEEERHKVVNSPTAVAVRQPVHQRSTGRWRHYEPWLREHFDRLLPMCQAFGYE